MLFGVALKEAPALLLCVVGEYLQDQPAAEPDGLIAEVTDFHGFYRNLAPLDPIGSYPSPPGSNQKLTPQLYLMKRWP